MHVRVVPRKQEFFFLFSAFSLCFLFVNSSIRVIPRKCDSGWFPGNVFFLWLSYAFRSPFSLFSLWFVFDCSSFVLCLVFDCSLFVSVMFLWFVFDSALTVLRLFLALILIVFDLSLNCLWFVFDVLIHFSFSFLWSRKKHARRLSLRSQTACASAVRVIKHF